MDRINRFAWWIACAAFLPLGTDVARAQATKAGEGRLTLIVTDGPDGRPVPCRMHLKNQHGAYRKVPGTPFWLDHFAFPGQVDLTLTKGNYTFLIERGPEYVYQAGHFSIQSFAKDSKSIPLKRAVDMAAAGWWSGDLHVERTEKEIELLMQAEDLYVAPLVVWTNRKAAKAAPDLPPPEPVALADNRYYAPAAGYDERAGGALLFFGLREALQLPTAAEAKSIVTDELAAELRADNQVWIDAPRANAWDLPIWLARGFIDSIGVVDDRFGRSGSAHKERLPGRLPQRPRREDRIDLIDEGRWLQEIYFQVLNAGFRLPPTASSATGLAGNHLGYNRLYAWVERDSFSYPAWWEAIRQGRVVATNGPLLQPQANGHLPGHVFTLPAEGALELDVAMNMTIRDPVSYLELIQNGRLVQSLRLDDWARTGHFPTVKVTEPGWALVRVATEVRETYRFAITGPWYIERSPDEPTIRRRAIEFFLTWLDERAAEFGVDATARKFWEERLSQATAD